MNNLLNIDIKCDIIPYGLRWDYMNNNVLVSTAMINAFWERNHSDTLDLILPFLKYAIAKNTQLGEKVCINPLQETLNEEFGFDSIPRHVIKVMLKRLSPKVLECKDNEYTLKKPLFDIIDSIDKKRTVFREHSHAVSQKLAEYLNENYKKGKYDGCSALDALTRFFVSNGICIVRDTSLLKLLKSKDDRLDYCVAQFILNEHEEKSHIFSFILEMVQGFFISTAIYLQPDNASITKAKFKGLCCYLDSGIVLKALGLKSEEEKESSLEMLQMLVDNNAGLYMFRHSYEELCDIICAYKQSIEYSSNHNHKSTHTLEYFDNKHYSPTDVERYLTSLQNKIEALGVSIVEKPEYDVSFTIDEKSFTQYIDQNIDYKRSRRALTRDIDSISAIYRLRRGIYSTEIERCNHLFVTTNVKLVNYSRAFFKRELKNHVPLAISDMNLSAITWIKSYSTNKDFPTNKIIENSLSCIEPSAQFVADLLEKIDKLNAEGKITADEAAIYRTSLYCKKEITKEVQGDYRAINEDILLHVFSRFKSTLKKEEEQQTELRYQEYLQERKKRRESLDKAIVQIKQAEMKSKKVAVRICWILYWTLFSILLVVCGYSLISGFVNEGNISIVGCILLLIDLYGLIDVLLLSNRSAIKKLINHIAFRYSSYKADKKRIEIESILGDLNTEDF